MGQTPQTGPSSHLSLRGPNRAITARALPLRQTLAASRLPCTSARWAHGLSLTPAACQPRSCALESLGVGRMDGVAIFSVEAGRRAQRLRQAPTIAQPHGPPCPHYQAQVNSSSPHTHPRHLFPNGFAATAAGARAEFLALGAPLCGIKPQRIAVASPCFLHHLDLAQVVT